MKKLLFTLFSIVFLFSCSESAKDIDVNKIENACDFLDAVGVVQDHHLNFMEKYQDIDEENIPESDMKEIEDLEEKMDELEGVMYKNEWETEITDCSNFKDVDEKCTKSGITIFWNQGEKIK